MLLSKFFIHDYMGEPERPSAPISIPGTSPPGTSTYVCSSFFCCLCDVSRARSHFL